jgi:hypothetical protein
MSLWGRLPFTVCRSPFTVHRSAFAVRWRSQDIGNTYVFSTGNSYGPKGHDNLAQGLPWVNLPN